MPTNITGAQGNQTLDCTAVQYNFSNNATQNAGTTTEFVPGAGPVQAITWGGAYTFTSAGTGIIKFSGTAALHLLLQPSGAATTWVYASKYVQCSSTGALLCFYCDMAYVSLFMTTGATNSTIDHCRGFGAGNSTGIFVITTTAGTNTITNNVGMFSQGDVFDYSPSGGTNDFSGNYAAFGLVGVRFGASGGTHSGTGLKVNRCGSAALISGTPVTMTNVLFHDCLVSWGGTQFNNNVTWTRLTITGAGLTGGNQVLVTPAAGKVHTFDEFYIRGDAGRLLTNLGAVADCVATNGVLAGPSHTWTAALEALYKCTSSGCDVVSGSGGVIVTLGTTNNDFISGGGYAWFGSQPMMADSGLNWADANFAYNYDGDSGNTTSTSTPSQYGGPLAANRTNPRTAPNKPLTVTSIVATPGVNTVNVTFTTGIKARSRLLIGTSAGVTRANATTTSPWKYHGFLDPELVDFTLPVTSHNHDVPLPPGTYYAVPECYDPCGRRFLGAETQFTIAAAAGGGGRTGAVSSQLVGASRQP